MPLGSSTIDEERSQTEAKDAAQLRLVSFCHGLGTEIWRASEPQETSDIGPEVWLVSTYAPHLPLQMWLDR